MKGVSDWRSKTFTFTKLTSNEVNYQKSVTANF